MKLMQFQMLAINKLLKCMEEEKRDIILKSPTGSGKTIILTHFMDMYLKGNPKTVFIWLTPGQGNLEEQSKAKMDKYIHNSQTKLLSDVMNSGFEENDCCFINWEKLTYRGNRALRDSERTNFLEWIEKAFDNGLVFKVIIDESHHNFTEAADTIIQYFKTDKIIRCSATPLQDRNASLIEVSENHVIAEGLIKKMIVINEDIPQEIEFNDDESERETEYLLERALAKQRQLRVLFANKGSNVNPLLVVQLPNNDDSLLACVEEFFDKKGINYENNTLAIWISNRHENLENISCNDNEVVAIIIKQAVATGWDCPRAHVLAKLRHHGGDTFEIQTIGRIRRMPEAKHYENDALDSCYLYTYDPTFKDGIRMGLGKSSLDAKTIFIKNEHKNISLIKQQRTMVTELRDNRKAQESIYKYFKDKYDLENDKKQNVIKLQSCGFVVAEEIVKYTLSGKVVLLSDLTDKEKLNLITIKQPINTHIHGREYHNCVGKIGLEIGIPYQYINIIIGRLFGDKIYNKKITNFRPRSLYAFIINNADLLRRCFREAMAVQLDQISLDLKMVSEKEFKIPQSILFTYDSTNTFLNIESTKNVYQGYLLSAELRSSGERKFEKFCERCDAVNWIYKNGDKGDEYFSIIYQDNSGHQKLFYPDYIISMNNEIWIIETKGGFDRVGNSNDIDIFSSKKFNVLKNYLNKYQLKGGFVRFDAQSEELCICMEKYSDDIHSNSWKLLRDIFK